MLQRLAREELAASEIVMVDVPEGVTICGGGGVTDALPPPLSTREVEVLRLVVQGLANKEIAVQLKISESAVKNTLQQLFGKAGVRTRSQLVRVALEQYRELL